MNDLGKLIVELFSLSGCFWILFYLYSNYSIKGFIVKRYIQETNLSNTVFFREHAPFIKSLPDFLSAGFYATHLLVFVWGWKFVMYIKTKNPDVSYFSDISNREYVTRHFTNQEILKAKRVLISGIIFFMHILAYFFIICIWPEAFG